MSLVDGLAAPVELGEPLAWKPGHVGAHAYQSQAGASIELPDVGEFEHDQPFSYGAWVKIPPRHQFTARSFSRMDEAKDYRGWDLWLEGGRIGTHIIHKWPDNALKAVANTPLEAEQVDARLRHLRRFGQGVAGLKIYINGKAESVRASQATELKARSARPSRSRWPSATTRAG